MIGEKSLFEQAVEARNMIPASYQTWKRTAESRCAKHSGIPEYRAFWHGTRALLSVFGGGPSLALYSTATKLYKPYRRIPMESPCPQPTRTTNIFSKCGTGIIFYG